MSFTLSGFAAADLGVVLTEAPTWRDVPKRSRQTASIPGRPGAVDLAGVDDVDGRVLELVGTQSATDRTALLGFLDQLKRRLARPALEIVLPDSTRFFRGRLEEVQVTPIPPAFSQRAHQIRISIACDDPRAYEAAASVIAFGAATAMPLGTAPIGPVIRLTTPSNPEVTYRDSDGVIRGSFELSTTGVTWVEVDSEAMTIRDNTGADRSDDLVDGDFIVLDPAHADAAGTDWPTLERSGAASSTATFRQAWW